MCTAMRGSSTQRGYGYQHKAIRAALIAEATHCATCGKPFAEGELKTAGHVQGLRHGGTSTDGNYVVECTKCNYGWNRKKK